MYHFIITSDAMQLIFFLEILENTSQTLNATSVQPVTYPTETTECQGSNCPSAGVSGGTQLQASLRSVLLVGLLSLFVLYWGKTRPSRDTSCISFMYTQISSSHIGKNNLSFCLLNCQLQISTEALLLMKVEHLQSWKSSFSCSFWRIFKMFYIYSSKLIELQYQWLMV